MAKKDKNIEIFNKLRNLFPNENKLKLSPEEIEYLAAVIILELDKGNRLQTLSKLDQNILESLKTDSKKDIIFKKTVYDNKLRNPNIDKKI